MITSPEPVSEEQDILTPVISQVLATGCNEFAVEYAGGEERVIAKNGPAAISTGLYKWPSKEAMELRKQLYAAGNKEKQVVLDGTQYMLRAEILDAFGEDAFRATITPAYAQH